MSHPQPIQTLQQLVGINSVNPEWGGPGEGEVADYLVHFFKDHGIPCWTQEVLPGRHNVLARVRRGAPGPGLLLEAHMDTVGVERMTLAPFDPVIRDGRLQGRGSCDVKASLAAMMHALVDFQSKTSSSGDVLLAAVVDEEHLFRGVSALLADLPSDFHPAAAVVAEPTSMQLARANKGVLRFRVTAHGLASHSSKPHLGANAITAMARWLVLLEDQPSHGAVPAHPLVGPATCVAGIIEGGQQVNFVPDRCTVSLDRRLLPGESAKACLAACRASLDQVERACAGIRFEMEEPFLVDEAMETPTDAGIVRRTGEVLQKMGLNPEPIGVPFGCDATKVSRAGIPSVIVGPGSIDQAHTPDEFIELEQFDLAFDFYRHLLRDFFIP